MTMIGQTGRRDVEVQAVLVLRAKREAWKLQATRREHRRIADAVPLGWRLRSSPPQSLSGRSAVRQPAEHVASRHGHAADAASVDGHDRRAVGVRSRGGYAAADSGAAGPAEVERGQGY